MKLQLKHLSPYLPYELKLKEGVLSSISGRWGTVKYIDSVGDDYNTSIERVKPLFIPLSDLTKNIEVNGRIIIPIEYISTSVSDSQRTMRRVVHNLSLDNIEYWKMERLFELHFDVFRLIDEGLAIDINSLKK